MDLQEWELLDDDDDDDQGLVLQTSHGGSGSNKNFHPPPPPPPPPPPCLLNNTSTILHMNYFICPPPLSSTPVEFVEKTSHLQRPLDVPIIHLEPPATASDQPKARPQTTSSTAPVESSEYMRSLHTHTDPDPVSYVFFKKMKKEIAEFADIIKVDSATSINGNGKGIIRTPPEGAGRGSSNFHQFDAGAEGDPDCEIEDLDLELGSRNTELVEEAAAEGGDGINYIFKWSLSGIGAICSFGVATVCIIVFNSHTKISKHTHRQNDHIKLRFQTHYTKYRLRPRRPDKEVRVVSWGTAK